MNTSHLNKLFSNDALEGDFRIKDISRLLYKEDSYQSDNKSCPACAYIAIVLINKFYMMELEKRPLPPRILKILGLKPLSRNTVQSYTLSDLYNIMQKFLELYQDILNAINALNYQIYSTNENIKRAKRKELLIEPSEFGIEKSWQFFEKNDMIAALYNFGCNIIAHISESISVIYDAYQKETRKVKPVPQGSAGVLIRKVVIESNDKRVEVIGGAIDLLVMFATIYRLIFYDIFTIHDQLPISDIKYIEPDEQTVIDNIETLSNAFKVFNDVQEFRFDLFERTCHNAQPEYFDCYYYYVNKDNFIEHCIKKNVEINIDITVRLLRAISPKYFDDYIGMQETLCNNAIDMLTKKDGKWNRPIRNIMILLITDYWFSIRHSYDDTESRTPIWIRKFVKTRFKKHDLMKDILTYKLPWIVEYIPQHWGVLCKNKQLLVHNDVDVVIAKWWEIVQTQFYGELANKINIRDKFVWDMSDYKSEYLTNVIDREEELKVPRCFIDGTEDEQDDGDNYLQLERDVLNFISAPTTKTNLTAIDLLKGVDTPKATATQLIEAQQIRENIERLENNLKRRNKKRKTNDDMQVDED